MRDMIFKAVSYLLVAFLSGACATGGGSISGNDEGSDPINHTETNEYKKAILKCYKTGGTRVVKIEGILRCY